VCSLYETSDTESHFCRSCLTSILARFSLHQQPGICSVFTVQNPLNLSCNQRYGLAIFLHSFLRNTTNQLDKNYTGVLMDINNLKAFIAVAENKSFSKSAESLNISQPAISKRIAALEAELSSKMFDRVNRKVYLTEAGRMLLPVAQSVLSDISRIEHDISCLGKGTRGKLSIGSTEHVCINRISAIIKTFKEAFPEVEIDLQLSKTDETLDRLHSGDLDMALCADISSNTIDRSLSKLQGVEIWREKLVVVSDDNHSLAKNKKITISQLASHAAILPKKYSAARRSIDQAIVKHHGKSISSMEANDFRTISIMASTGLGWACLPRSELNNSLVVLDVPDLDLHQSVELIRNTDRSTSHAAQAFLNFLQTDQKLPAIFFQAFLLTRTSKPASQG